MPRRPLLAVAVVFLLAAFSKVTLALPVGTMRLEQPALVGLIALTIWHRKALALPPLRPLAAIIVAGLIYLGTLTLSSTIAATDPGASLRLVAWTALSMAGGLVTALILAGRAARSITSFSAPAALVATLGLVSAIAYLLFAIGEPWVDSPLTDMPRISAFVLEPNLYASLLAAVIPLALERWRARPSLAALAIALVLLLSIGLGVTRGAYIGLAAGLIVMFGMNLLRSGRPAGLRAVAVIVLVAGGAGLLMPKVLLIENAGLIGQGPPSGPSNPTTPPSQPTQPTDDLQTFAYRMERVFVGLDEWRESPVIGLGAYSYGQRHRAGPNPDVISVWPVLVLHDAGIIGLGGFLAVLGLLGLRLWRTSGDPVRGPTANAYAAAVVVLLVAYLATTALHFAVTWMILGGALAATIRWPRADAAGSDQSSDLAGPAWRLTAPLTERSREGRYQKFVGLIAPRREERLLDVGVNNSTWRSSNFLESRYPWPAQICAVSPYPAAEFERAFPDVRFLVADGRSLPFKDGEFDIGFSNAVIEHVGSRDQQRQFATEITRTCGRVFLCTPNRWFPIDPHTLLPFVHWLPRRLRDPLLRATGNGHWASEQMLNPLGASDLRSLFPQGTEVRIERQRAFALTSVLIAIVEPHPGR